MNLENLNVQELNTEDQKNVDGGFFGPFLGTWSRVGNIWGSNSLEDTGGYS
jgi:hypothetical protein